MTSNLDLITSSAVALRGATNIVMILDRSGSMANAASDVIGGFNAFVASCREADVARCSLSYVRFDNEVERVFTHELAAVPELDSLLYQVRGGTALLDAVGATVSSIADAPDDRFIVITFTDGHENASREWTKDGVARLLRERTALGNWTFGFFGADIDAWSEAGGMGYDARNSASYAKRDTAGMMKASGRVSSVMAKSKMRSSSRYAEAVRFAALQPDALDAEIEEQLDGGEDDTNGDK